MLHDDYLCLAEFGKQQIKEVRRKNYRKTWKQRQLLRESGFVLRNAPTPLSRNKRIDMKKSNQISHKSRQQNLSCAAPIERFLSQHLPLNFFLGRYCFCVIFAFSSIKASDVVLEDVLGLEDRFVKSLASTMLSLAVALASALLGLGFCAVLGSRTRYF